MKKNGHDEVLSMAVAAVTVLVLVVGVNRSLPRGCTRLPGEANSRPSEG